MKNYSHYLYNAVKKVLFLVGFISKFFFSTDVTERTLTNCSSVLERVSSLADSAYGTDDLLLRETTSLTDYCSDPFSSTFTPVKDVASSPSKETTGPHAKT